MLHNTEIFQCFLSAREVARSRDRERVTSTSLGSVSVSRSGGGGEEDSILSQEGRRGSTGLLEGQDLYTAACNSVIHRCALLVLGVSPVLGELTKQNQEEGQTQSATGTQECLSFMTRSGHSTLKWSWITLVFREFKWFQGMSIMHPFLKAKHGNEGRYLPH